MRAARLLHLLMLLQNRGRLTTAELAQILEVSRRTVLRDLDALSEAGLPLVVTRGSKGGVELGFGYRTQLTGLSHEEAEALGVLLSLPAAWLAPIGLDRAARQVQSKLIESLAPSVRDAVLRVRDQFRIEAPEPRTDPRLSAMALAVRERRVVRLRNHSEHPVVVHPCALRWGSAISLFDARSSSWVPSSAWGAINISAHRFETS
ncbi:MAG: HTH domain-containing protein [Myxococcota bacterium]